MAAPEITVQTPHADEAASHSDNTEEEKKGKTNDGDKASNAP